MCLNRSVEGVGYGKQESCVQEKCLIECHQCWGSLGRSVLSSCLEPWPCSCKNIRPQTEIQRSSLGEPAGHSPGWSMAEWGEAGRVCVCAQTQPGARCKSQVCCVPVCRNGAHKVKSDAGRAASSFSLVKEELSKDVFTFLGNNRKAWPNCCSKSMPMASEKPSRI